MAKPLSGVVLLAAFTRRSQAYAQALARNGLAPEHVLTYGPEAPPMPASAHADWQGVVCHNPGESLLATCTAAGWRTSHCAAEDVNADEVVAQLAALHPHLVIYSGGGGQIVGNRMLGLGAPFLHLHCGWLPDYPGSTTIYYALLNGEKPAVSAILLDPRIDTGPIIARATYPRPPADMDIDNLYDPALRADLLVAVIRKYADCGHLPAAQAQPGDGNTPYFVIHPVLKHLARLSLENQ